MSLQFNAPAPMELTEEEVVPFKETLLAFLRTRNAQARQQVDANLHVARGERVPAFTFSLQVLLESRSPKPENVTKLVSEIPEALRPAENVMPPAPPPEPINVWEFASEIRPDFSPHSNTYFVPNTLQVRECNECYQRGESGCRACFGKGIEACQTCLGSGSQPCMYCRGLEKITCIKCGGEGRMMAGGVHGVGRSARCDACQGTGKFACSHCKEGKTDCAGCSGSGKIACRKCEGKGKVACALCHGEKKIVLGLAFKADFVSAVVTASGLALPAPREAMDLGVQTVTGSEEISVDLQEPFEQQVLGLDSSNPAKPVLVQLLDRLRPRMSGSTRLVRAKLTWGVGALVRLSGYCAGQEFTFWMAPGKGDIVAEKDPLATLSTTVAEAAEEAEHSGDWMRAVSLANETLSYSPDNPSALGILSDWREKIIKEAVAVAVLAGAVSAGVFAAIILRDPRGLFKVGAIVRTAGFQFGISFLIVVVLLPVLLKLYRARIRWLALAGGMVAGPFLFSTVAYKFLHWNPVRIADQAALDREMSNHFKLGVAQIYHAPDLTYLEDLYAKYKNSYADLVKVRTQIDRQLELKNEFENIQKVFDKKVAGVMASFQTWEAKKKQIEELRDYYKLMNVNIDSAQRALTHLAQLEREAMMRNNQVGSRIRVGGRSSSRVSLAPAGKKPFKKQIAPAAKNSKVKKPAAKKSVKRKVRSGGHIGGLWPEEQ